MSPVYDKNPETEQLLAELVRIQAESGEAAAAFNKTGRRDIEGLMQITDLLERTTRRSEEIMRALQQHRLDA